MTAPIAFGLISKNTKEPALIGSQCPNAGKYCLIVPRENLSRMAAFPETGRSEAPKTAKSKVRFRPEADVNNLIRRLDIDPDLILRL
jgi:hypothetical protein